MWQEDKKGKVERGSYVSSEILKIEWNVSLNSSELLKLWFWENPQMSWDKGSQHLPNPSIPLDSIFLFSSPLYTSWAVQLQILQNKQR